MSLHALRRWFARHPDAWVLGVALGLALTLGGAQLVAACHEISHVVADARAPGGQDAHDQHASSAHDCPTCMLAAALGGAATAAPSLSLPVPDGTIAAPLSVERAFTPRFARAYASRAPPPATATTA